MGGITSSQGKQPRFVIRGEHPVPPPVPARRCPPVPSTHPPPSVSPRGGAVKRSSPGGSESPSKRGSAAEGQKKASRRNLFGDPPATSPPIGVSTSLRDQSGAPHTYAAVAQSRYSINAKSNENLLHT